MCVLNNILFVTLYLVSIVHRSSDFEWFESGDSFFVRKKRDDNFIFLVVE